jgi:AcrR family transcriptional regulator
VATQSSIKAKSGAPSSVAKVQKPKRVAAGKAVTSEAAKPVRVKLRLASADRERQIIEGAIAYFSEAGFSGQTRELSSRLGITQPLLYRYFASKQALIERVYQTVFEGRWNPAWMAPLRDRSRPLRDRLVEFYRQYSSATYRPEWIRIYMHAGLSDPRLNRRYIQLVRRELMPVVCRELRHACGLPDTDTPVTEEEIEFVWSLHGGIFYQAMRQHVYKTRITVDFMTHVALVVDNFLAGAATVYPQLLARVAPAALGAVGAKAGVRANATAKPKASVQTR